MVIDRYMITDCHTHDRNSHIGIISLQPHEMSDMSPGHLYSVGIHPWHAAEATEDDWSRVEDAAVRDEVVMLGESGLDALCDTPREVQELTFRRMIAISERVRKPLVIHAVKTFQEIIALHRELSPSQPWIIHGFRGKPQLAAQLVREGFYISLGPRYNEEALAVIPYDRLLCESDEAPAAPDLGSASAENLRRLIARADGE